LNNKGGWFSCAGLAVKISPTVLAKLGATDGPSPEMHALRLSFVRAMTSAVTVTKSRLSAADQFEQYMGRQALNVASAALEAARGKTTTQKAAEIKAEADLTAQQQRLVQCLADPKNCK
jgi:hypothetical protein